MNNNMVHKIGNEVVILFYFVIFALVDCSAYVEKCGGGGGGYCYMGSRRRHKAEDSVLKRRE
jgi:hypothetical protein